jgi:hypothetical protein
VPHPKSRDETKHGTDVFPAEPKFRSIPAADWEHDREWHNLQFVPFNRSLQPSGQQNSGKPKPPTGTDAGGKVSIVTTA